MKKKDTMTRNRTAISLGSCCLVLLFFVFEHLLWSKIQLTSFIGCVSCVCDLESMHLLIESCGDETIFNVIKSIIWPRKNILMWCDHFIGCHFKWREVIFLHSIDPIQLIDARKTIDIILLLARLHFILSCNV